MAQYAAYPAAVMAFLQTLHADVASRDPNKGPCSACVIHERVYGGLRHKHAVCRLPQDLERRNIHIKRYEDIPLADTEIIFPDKKIYIKPITVIQLFITILGGIVAALVTAWNVCS